MVTDIYYEWSIAPTDGRKHSHRCQMVSGCNGRRCNISLWSPLPSLAAEVRQRQKTKAPEAYHLTKSQRSLVGSLRRGAVSSFGRSESLCTADTTKSTCRSAAHFRASLPSPPPTHIHPPSLPSIHLTPGPVPFLSFGHFFYFPPSFFVIPPLRRRHPGSRGRAQGSKGSPAWTIGEKGQSDTEGPGLWACPAHLRPTLTTTTTA